MVSVGQTLLDMAKSQLKTYDILISAAREDMRIIECAAFHLHQSIELALKHCMELSDTQYPPTADVGQLLSAMDFSDIFSKNTLESLFLASGTITEMGAEFRYTRDYCLSSSTVSDVAGLTRSVLVEVEHFTNARGS